MHQGPIIRTHTASQCFPYLDHTAIEVLHPVHSAALPTGKEERGQKLTRPNSELLVLSLLGTCPKNTDTWTDTMRSTPTAPAHSCTIHTGKAGRDLAGHQQRSAQGRNAATHNTTLP